MFGWIGGGDRSKPNANRILRIRLTHYRFLHSVAPATVNLLNSGVSRGSRVAWRRARRNLAVHFTPIGRGSYRRTPDEDRLILDYFKDLEKQEGDYQGLPGPNGRSNNCRDFSRKLFDEIQDAVDNHRKKKGDFVIPRTTFPIKPPVAATHHSQLSLTRICYSHRLVVKVTAATARTSARINSKMNFHVIVRRPTAYDANAIGTQKGL